MTALADAARRYANSLRSRLGRIRAELAALPPGDRRRELEIEAGHVAHELTEIEAGGAASINSVS